MYQDSPQIDTYPLPNNGYGYAKPLRMGAARPS